MSSKFSIGDISKLQKCRLSSYCNEGSSCSTHQFILSHHLTLIVQLFYTYKPDYVHSCHRLKGSFMEISSCMLAGGELWELNHKNRVNRNTILLKNIIFNFWILMYKYINLLLRSFHINENLKTVHNEIVFDRLPILLLDAIGSKV